MAVAAQHVERDGKLLFGGSLRNFGDCLQMEGERSRATQTLSSCYTDDAMITIPGR